MEKPPSNPVRFTITYAGLSGGFAVSLSTITVEVSGTDVYGSAPSFSETDDAPAPVTLNGTLACTYDSGGTEAVGTYTVDASTCSGLAPSDATDYSIAYAGLSGGFAVTPATITVEVSGTDVYGSAPSFSEADDAPAGVTLSGTLACTYDSGGTQAVGTYTVDAGTCSGLTPSDAADYTIVYAGSSGGFVVTPATITVEVSGTDVYGGAPRFTETDDAPAGVTLYGALACKYDSGGNEAVGTYTVDPGTCSGLAPSDATDYTITYVGSSEGFVVSPATITVRVRGSQVYGSSPSFTETDDAPSGVTLSGRLTCTSVVGGSPFDVLDVGTYTVDGSTCSGLKPFDATDYQVSYVGTNDRYAVKPKDLIVNVSGTEVLGSAPAFTEKAPVTLTGTLACSEVTSHSSISSLGAGSYTVDGSSCSGLKPQGNPADYNLSYRGITSNFIVRDPRPIVTSVDPGSGPESGGTAITIDGTGFFGQNVSVVIGAVAATNVVVVSPTEMTAATGAGTSGKFAVFVTTGGGTSPRAAAAAFTYQK